jgi:MFS family permease
VSSIQTQREKNRATALGTMVGAGIEWYDFYVFGIAAALVFNKIFFPGVDPAVGTLLSFATFATAWFARPLGGIIFSHLGDRIGRKHIMLVTLILMGTATSVIGLLPDARAIGVGAPIGLVILRFIQGLACGGEWGAATVTAVENAPPGKRGLFGAFPQMGVPMGLFLSSGVSLLFYMLPEDQLLAWGWRIPFLLTVVFVVVGQYIRRRLPESDDFKEAAKNGEIVRFPMLEALRRHPRAVLTVFLGQAIVNVTFFTATTFILDYATTHSTFQRTTVLSVVALAAVVDFFAILAGGLLADRFGAKRVYVTACAAGIVVFAAIFPLTDTGNIVALILGIGVLFPSVHGLAFGAQASFFASLFPPNVRLSGMSTGFQFSGMAFGGPLPLLAGFLVTTASGSPWLLVGYIGVVGLISTVGTLTSPREFSPGASAKPAHEAHANSR